jgi:hypothetical protein
MWALWGFEGNISFGHDAFSLICDVVRGDDLPDVPFESKAYVQTTRAIKVKGGEMK